jgi:hypothetical protein
MDSFEARGSCRGETPSSTCTARVLRRRSQPKAEVASWRCVKTPENSSSATRALAPRLGVAVELAWGVAGAEHLLAAFGDFAEPAGTVWSKLPWRDHQGPPAALYGFTESFRISLTPSA